MVKSNSPILRLVVPTPLRRCFDYLLPKNLPENFNLDLLQPGMRLRIPFHRRETVGVLLEVTDSTEVPVDKLRHAFEIIDNDPVLPPDLMKLLQWASDYYQHPLGDVIFTALPVLLRKGKPWQAPVEKLWKLTREGRLINPQELKRAKRQQVAIELLQEHADGLTVDELRQAGVQKTVLSALQTKQLVTEETPSDPISSLQDTISLITSDTLLKQTPLSLHEEQQEALDLITQPSSQFAATLLEGVTGSGKTEVYLQAIEQILRQNKQALVLIPEIGLTPQTVNRFQQRFNTKVALLHSGLTDRERLNAWRKAKLGEAGIIIGTRSAIFTPCHSLGIIIIDEEHDASYKQQDTFRYSARDLAVMRAKSRNIPIVLGSATPSIESIFNAKSGRYQHQHLRERAGGAQAPEFHVLDVRGQSLTEGISGALFGAIEDHLDKGGQALLFVNRRGYAPSLICHQCGWVAVCHRCDAKMTMHYGSQLLRCHHCEAQRRIDAQCPSCHSQSLLPVGQGTERVESILAKRFPNIGIARIDRDTTSRKGAMQQQLNDFDEGRLKILIGTQMLAKGHHFPNLTLVAIVDIDGGLYCADFRAVERMAQLIIQVAGRAGRENKAGEVFLQTRNPHNPLLRHLISQDYPGFVDAVLLERQQASLPPYSYLALFRAESTNKNEPMQFLKKLLDYAKLKQSSAIQILGPIPSVMEKRAGKYRAQLLCQAANRSLLKPFLQDLLRYLESSRDSRYVRWSLDVDPQEMF